MSTGSSSAATSPSRGSGASDGRCASAHAAPVRTSGSGSRSAVSSAGVTPEPVGKRASSRAALARRTMSVRPPPSIASSPGTLPASSCLASAMLVASARRSARTASAGNQVRTRSAAQGASRSV